MRTSPIFSMADPVKMTVHEPNTFLDFGASHDGNHIVVMFRSLVDVALKIDHENPVVLNRYCTMYNFINNRGTLYGHLFVTEVRVTKVKDNRLIVKCEDHDTSFELQALSNDKTKLLIFKNSSGSVLALITGNEASTYAVEGD